MAKIDGRWTLLCARIDVLAGDGAICLLDGFE